MIATSSKNRTVSQTRTYARTESVVFLKTKESFGGLSNMAGGFPLRVNGIRMLTSEALYQACRFPHLPDVQRLIIEENSPMTAKMKSKPHRQNSRPDWDQVRVKIMRWCLRVKLAQNWNAFSKLLLETGDRAIVEESRKDDFWGAKPIDERTLVGMNVLGQLLMELREAIKADSRDSFLHVEPIAIPDFLLGGRPIEMVTAQDAEVADTMAQPVGHPSHIDVDSRELTAPSLFNALMVKEAASPAYPDVIEKVVRVADLLPYPEYKPTAQAWLGEVPQHWSVLPNRALFTEVKDRNHPDEEMLSVTITRGIVRQKALLAGSSKKDSSNLDKSAYKLVLPRDIAYNKMRAWQGAIGASELRGIISPAYVVMRLRMDDNLPRYFHHLYRTPQFAKEAERWSYGITSDMWSLRPEHFKIIYTPQPPPKEQAAIVRFLDWTNGRLEQTIRAKRKVILLLNEQKQAIIHRAVTRGLDPSVFLKPSGTPWLGDIPAHWDVLRSKYIYREVDDRSATGKEMHLSMSQKFGLIPSSQIEEKRLVSESYAGAKLCEKGDLVLNRLKAHLGVFALAPVSGLVSPDYTVFRPIRELNERYFEAVYRTPACRVELRQRAKGIVQGFWRLYTDDFYDIRLPVPPVDEQQSIMEKLDIDLSGIKIAISRLEREIELLREYRIRLVTDVVTGKLDVREAAARLPEEATPDIAEASDETESTDEEIAV